ncbi:hypothetical protein [Aquamicrobium sp.]|uniref:hypothetical protein n=1 Tax=Aquamicrobium sp. TaxID=1872579 RepID=UPI00258BC63C|nr:hypothetical protein [Aquamicrobium sp.]MCK9553200.1 hypothetical protein [Aquamicrobium sp.]
MTKEIFDDIFGKGNSNWQKVSFLRRCFFNDNGITVNWRANTPLIKLWKQAKDLDEFKVLLKKDKDAQKLQFTHEWLKTADKDYDQYLASIIKETATMQYDVWSDAGSVKVGNAQFSFLISHNNGDGHAIAAVFKNEKDFISSPMKFITSVEGTFNIYDYDCGQNVIVTLNGRYDVYVYCGITCFVKK